MKSRYRMPILLVGLLAITTCMVTQQQTSAQDAAAKPAENPLAIAPTEPLTAKIKTLFVTGGDLHDAKGNADVVQEAMEKTGYFELTRVDGDLNAFLADRIAPYDLIVFFWTMGEITEAQKRGLMNHIASGKGFVTFHSGSDAFRGDPDYEAMVGGHFITHPEYRVFHVSTTLADPNDPKVEHPIMRGIKEFMINDEQYVLNFCPRVKVLANSLYRGELMPVIWTKDWGKGRVFYSSLGHDPKACEQEMFQVTLLRGMLWAAGQLK